MTDVAKTINVGGKRYNLVKVFPSKKAADEYAAIAKGNNWKTKMFKITTYSLYLRKT